MMFRPISAAAAILTLCAPPITADQSQAPLLRVTLLGTGTPLPRVDRFGPATLVEAGTEKLLVDCGRGCTMRLFERRVPLRDVRLFLTHLHSEVGEDLMTIDIGDTIRIDRRSAR